MTKEEAKEKLIKLNDYGITWEGLGRQLFWSGNSVRKFANNDHELRVTEQRANRINKLLGGFE